MTSFDVQIDHNTRNPTFSLTRAMLVYTSDNSDYFITTHRITTDKKGLPVIGAGAPLTKTKISQLKEILAPQSRKPLTLLTDNILALSDTTTVWWRPASRRIMRFNIRATEDKHPSLRHLRTRIEVEIPLPALLFAANPDDLFVYALKDSVRPETSTQLFRAPFFNIYRNCSLCWGTITKPKTPQPTSLPSYESAIFDSWSTHVNDVDPTLFTGGLIALVNHLIDHPQTPFPIETLSPLDTDQPKTLGNMLARIGR